MVTYHVDRHTAQRFQLLDRHIFLLGVSTLRLVPKG
jgi:hypothetical protein